MWARGLSVAESQEAMHNLPNTRLERSMGMSDVQISHPLKTVRAQTQFLGGVGYVVKSVISVVLRGGRSFCLPLSLPPTPFSETSATPTSLISLL